MTNIKSTYLTLLMVLLSVSSILAQQESQFINISNNPYMVNSAAGGLSGVAQFELSSRVQWLGYNGGPRTFMLTGNSQIKMKKSSEKVLEEFNIDDKALFEAPKSTTGKLKHIVGGRVMNDAIGPFAKTSIFGSYAIHLPFTKKLNFGAGVGVGWSNFRLDEERVALYDTDDQAYSQFLGNSSAQNIFDANAGIVFYNENFFGGFSITQMFNNDVVFNDISTSSNYNRHYFLTLKYLIGIGESFGIEPTVVGKMAERTPASFDLGARFVYNNSVWLGIQYRTSNAMTFQVGANLIKNLYLAYGYEHAIGAISTSSNGSHEIQLGIYIGRNRNLDKEIKGSEK